MIKGEISPYSGGGRFRIIARGLPEEVGYILQSSESDFMYEAVDADLRIEIDGKSPFPPGSPRLSDDGFLRYIPILDFAWRLIVACKHIGVPNPSTERVTVTSTDYVLEFDRKGDFIELKVGREGKSSRILAETVLTTGELQHQCKSFAEISLAAILRENPALKGNPHLKRFAAEIEILNDQTETSSKTIS